MSTQAPLPERIDDLEALEELLSRPTGAAARALAVAGGDVLVLGAGGKMGPTLARMARRALDRAGSTAEVIAVSRFSDGEARRRLEARGVRTVPCDLADPAAVASLPDAAAVLFLAGRKFGTSGAASETWAANAWLPGLVAHRYAGVPTVVFSSGNVYPFVDAGGPGANEETPPSPVGEYAWSVLARERLFEHASRERGTPVLLLRLNYAVELRYGVLLDVATKVRDGAPIDLGTGVADVLWQGDANAMALASLGLACSPARVLNVTGRERVDVRALALRFGEALGREPVLRGEPAPTALLNDASLAHRLFGAPAISLDRAIDWVADWVRRGGPTLEKPTHFEARDGTY